jgi:gas vesicle protein
MQSQFEKTRIGEFLIGVGVGTAIGMLFAPRAGDKTRARLGEVANQGACHVKDYSVSLSDAVIGLKNEIERQRHGVAEAIKRGTSAYKQAVN